MQQSKINGKTTKCRNKNQLELKYEFLNYDTVAVSEKFGSKLSHKTAPQQKKLTAKTVANSKCFQVCTLSLHVYKIMYKVG